MSTTEVKDGVVSDYLRGDKTLVTQLEYNISPGEMYRILRARKVKLRRPWACRLPCPATPLTQGTQHHPLFFKYRREFLQEATGFSKGYLSRMANGKVNLSRAFIERVCYRLQLPEDELFCPKPEEERHA